jgi:G:T-mismatch repair DNA endonuclease (very short patch repair protein)
MARIRKADTRPELAVRRVAHRLGTDTDYIGATCRVLPTWFSQLAGR